MMRERGDAAREAFFFIAGALFGAGLTMLYAPRTGKEVREKVSDFTSDAMTKMKDFGSGAQEKFRTSFNKGKEMAEEKVSRFTSGREEGSETSH